MPFPQPAVEQLSQRAPRSPAWFGQLMLFAGTLFFIAVALYVGITFGYEPYLNHRVDTLNAKIATFAQQVPADQQQSIASFYSQIVNLKTLLNKHVAMSAFFAWLEKTTAPNVQITKISVDANNSQVSVSGVARSVPDIAAELATLQADPAVEHVNFKDVSTVTTGGWAFDMTVFFERGFFNQPGQIP